MRPREAFIALAALVLVAVYLRSCLQRPLCEPDLANAKLGADTIAAYMNTPSRCRE